RLDKVSLFRKSLAYEVHRTEQLWAFLAKYSSLKLGCSLDEGSCVTDQTEIVINLCHDIHHVSLSLWVRRQTGFDALRRLVENLTRCDVFTTCLGRIGNFEHVRHEFGYPGCAISFAQCSIALTLSGSRLYESADQSCENGYHSEGDQNHCSSVATDKLYRAI